MDSVKKVRAFSCVQPYMQHKQVSLLDMPPRSVWLLQARLLIPNARHASSVQCATGTLAQSLWFQSLASMLLGAMLSIELLWL
jgi:hypothetical protein